MEQRVIKIFPYSYSSLTSFETCPRKHYGERLSKEFARPYNKAADQGDIWHKQAEHYIVHGTDIPDTNPHRDGMRRALDDLMNTAAKRDSAATIQAEAELCVTKDLTPCGWWDAEGYSRAKLDISVVLGDEAWSLDWKTGKADVFSTQLKHSALLLFLHHPDLKKVHTRYEWLKEGFATKGTIHREFFNEDWAKFEQRVAKYQKAFDTNNWPAKKSGLCKNYCGVTTCEFNGKYKQS